MIGYRNSRYEFFGKFAARLDDLVNLIPARLTGVLFGLASLRFAKCLRLMFKQARQHRSPNAGWPEAALAAAIGVRLSGPRIYDGHVAQEPWVNGAGQDPDADDIGRGLRLFVQAMALAGFALVAASLLG